MGSGGSSQKGKTLNGYYRVKILDPKNYDKVQAVGRVKLTLTSLCYTDKKDEYHVPLENIIRYALKDGIVTVEVAGLNATQRETLNRTIFAFKSDYAKYLFKELDKYCKKVAKDIFKSTDKMMKGDYT